MVLKVFFPQCCNRADSGLMVGRWIPSHESAVVLAVIHYPFIPGQVKVYLQQMRAQSGVDLCILGSWSLPKEEEEGMESFLQDLSTIFPHRPTGRRRAGRPASWWSCYVRPPRRSASCSHGSSPCARPSVTYGEIRP
uniref:Phosphatidylinositol N-acetylglucosaminyltransferase subunit Q n=1 Tax=Gouania willdenowi TaxID=441366 RepID=A0A8C5GGF1_GOUWI